MREFKQGDKVFDYRFGHGNVVNVVTGNEDCYPVEVMFLSPHLTQSYTPDGKWNVSDFGPSIFHADEIPGQCEQTLTAAATMSRRDEFAIRIGVALIQRAGQPVGAAEPNATFTDPLVSVDRWVNWSTNMADALIAELDRTSQKEDGQ